MLFRYQNGGAACGFHHYEKKFEPRLFQLKGKRNVRLTEIANMDWTALNRSDSFLVDLSSTVFVWNGRNSNKMERLQVGDRPCLGSELLNLELVVALTRQ